MTKLAPWTTYSDSKNRKWVVIDLLPFDDKGNLCQEDQFVRIYLVGSNQLCQKIAIADWNKAVNDGLMIKN